METRGAGADASLPFPSPTRARARPQVAKGNHTRFVVTVDKFMAGAKKKMDELESKMFQDTAVNSLYTPR